MNKVTLAYIPYIFTRTSEVEPKMKFTTDSYMEIGNSHNICEDYTISGNIGEMSQSDDGNIPYIIVSDGCSSSKMTDFGSRIMAHSCKKMLNKSYWNGEMQEMLKDSTFGTDERRFHAYLAGAINQNAMNVMDQFGLPYTVCDATLLYAFIYKGMLYVRGYGDGNMLIKVNPSKEEADLVWHHLSYESNGPYYLSYEMDLIRKRIYMEDPRFGKVPFTVEKHGSECLVPDDSVTYPSTECFSYTIQAENVLSITLASDGAESYHHSAKRLSEDPPSQVEKDTLKGFGLMKRIVAYKNHKGEFVKRRMKKLKQEVEKIQAEHYDDVSCATIWIDHVKES